ncbi:hypothetical protein GCM10023185_15380 [Hymenobacter saemangeumensis]|uniref:DUF4468 domain-containing protein n=1 Tax=Hymenobacter saemangeumensis TaxID=1084522 RepID=A0ABP8I984_9BACT
MNHILPFLRILVVLLAGTSSAFAQKLEESLPPRTFRVGSMAAPLYRSPSDTAKSAPFHLPAGSEALVVGSWSPRWLVVRRSGFLYLTPIGLIKGINPVTFLPTEDAEEPILPLDAASKLVTYEGIIEVPGATQDQLYDRALDWMAKTYQSANDVVQIKDKEQGKLLAKGGILLFNNSTPAGFVVHTQTIYVKPGRYKYIMTGFKHQNIVLSGTTPRDASMGPLEQMAPPSGFSRKAWYGMLSSTNEKVKSMIKDLQKAMQPQGKDPGEF